MQAAGELSSAGACREQNGGCAPIAEQEQASTQSDGLASTRFTLADSASSVAALDLAQSPQNLPSDKVPTAESRPQHMEFVPCQPALAEQRHRSAMITSTNGSDDSETEETAVVIDEKVERGVTAADDGRRLAKFLPPSLRPWQTSW